MTRCVQALDRPEDRPNTLSWIVGGNILPGCVLIIFFRWVYQFTGQGDMTYIFLFITGIGDGFAEPVGIYLGKHKYWTASCMGDRKYVLARAAHSLDCRLTVSFSPPPTDTSARSRAVPACSSVA